MIFQKSSTITRVSFRRTGVYQLGGQALFLSIATFRSAAARPILGRGPCAEPLSGRHYDPHRQAEGVEDLANYGSIPIINGLTDFCHPCQVLADLMTIRESLPFLRVSRCATLATATTWQTR